MPVECRTDAPHSCPSPPFSPPRGEVTPEFAVPPLAACPVCLQAPASQPQAEDAVFPCCAAFTHLSCLVQCALRHGSCPNCRAAVDHLPREPSISSRCRQLAIDLEPTVPPAHDTAVTAVRDYSTRAAMDFVELPDARMHWAPVPQRRSDGIGAWQPLWLCMRCQSELQLDRINLPEPRPACPLCDVPLQWEVDMSRRQERWVCGRCPFAHLPRPLVLGPATRPPVDEGTLAGITDAPTSRVSNVLVPGRLPHDPEPHESMANLGTAVPGGIACAVGRPPPSQLHMPTPSTSLLPHSMPLPQFAADVADAGEDEAGTVTATTALHSSNRSQRRVCAAETGLLTGLASFDAVDLQDTLHQRVLTLQGVPTRLRGALRTAFRAGLQLIADRESPVQELRGWKLFCLAPRMLLHRSGGDSLIPPAELDRRCDLFARGAWPELLSAGSAASRPRSAAPRDDLAARAARATALVHIGELSAAGRALVAEPLAPGTPRGAAAGPSGATNEHLRILLDDEGDTQLLHCAACRLAHADLPPPVLAALRIGRMTALQKPNGRGIRALVVGDVLRRLVGRALAQAFAPHFQRACLPHQFGLSTRAGTEALARVLRAATELDPRATVLSVDAVGAFDHVSREAMLSALLRHPDLRPLVPFARQFYGTPSSYTWTDDSGRSHVIAQGEGGEQGDPLMPALYALAQQPALCEVQAQLQDGEAIFAFLDDTYVVAPPDRVRTLYDAFRAALWRHARVELNRGKTRVWNAAGEEPPGIADVQGDSDAVVWTGDWSLRPDLQGLLVLGTPLGSDAFVQSQLELKRAEHDKLLTRIPAVEDLQAAWLLLRFCACPRANYLLRVLPPAATLPFAAAHDGAVDRCLSALLGFADAPLPEASARSARLPLQCGGLGLRAASLDRHAAYWASWFDTLPVLRDRAPAAAARFLALLADHEAGRAPVVAAAAQAATHLVNQGFRAPAWDAAFADAAFPPDRAVEDGAGVDYLRGWQRRASRACDERAIETHFTDLSPASRALLLFQAGPHSGRVFTVLPTSDDVTIVSCSVGCVFPWRSAPAHADAAGASTRPVSFRLGRYRSSTPSPASAAKPALERIEVVCNGLPLWHGAQLAVDATLVSPLMGDGSPQPAADAQPGVSLARAAQRKRRHTYPELLRARRCRLVVFGLETGGRWSEEAATFLRLLAQARAGSAPAAVRRATPAAWVHRWSGILSVAAQQAFAASLLELPPAAELGAAGDPPALHELLADARWLQAPVNSRLPARTT
ncbi:132 kDa protein [Symbiodinium microadriaticum]|uniref:132 kDa protein n=1 Tax=Symbiodinium microadriaticum TaxID=2951 RepID=A0A1Q9C0C3_SYMMI|nr:132 kDa protein [Symbiodinium microadriaticum]